MTRDLSVNRNVIANFAGSIWSALMLLAFVPFYIRLMGVESYGIVGVFTSLMAMLAVLDLGLSQTMNREMARLSSDEKGSRQLAETARTLEFIYWGIGLLVGCLIALLSSFIAYQWLNPEQLSRDALQQALWIMALVIALRWPVALYTGGLNGLQRQVQANVLLIGISTAQGFGALAVLWFVEPSIQAFFWWQAGVALIQALLLRSALWNNLPDKEYAAFRMSIVSNLWRFAAGISGISLLAIVLTQLDKVLLSKMLTLSQFGYYTFAATAAAITGKVVGPIFTAYSPRLSALVAQNRQTELIKTYHQGCQLVSLALVPLVLMLAVFADEILGLWGQDPELVSNSGTLLSLLVIGNGLNGLMNLPYALQIAHGWTRLVLLTNLVAVFVLVPAIYFMTLHWGAEGAAWVWIVLNTGYLIFNVQIMHRRLLVNEKFRWYLQDVILPIIFPLLAVLLAKMVMPELSGMSDIAEIGVLVLLSGFVLFIASMSSLSGRSIAMRLLHPMPRSS